MVFKIPEVNMPAAEVASSLGGKCVLQKKGWLFTANPLFRWCGVIPKGFQGLHISFLPPPAVGLKSERQSCFILLRVPCILNY